MGPLRRRARPPRSCCDARLQAARRVPGRPSDVVRAASGAPLAAARAQCGAARWGTRWKARLAVPTSGPWCRIPTNYRRASSVPREAVRRRTPARRDTSQRLQAGPHSAARRESAADTPRGAAPSQTIAYTTLNVVAGSATEPSGAESQGLHSVGSHTCPAPFPRRRVRVA